MTKEELAEQLNGKEYRDEINPALLKAAKDSGLVVVYGASDDLMELEGTIEDEGGCYEGALFHIDQNGILPHKDSLDDDDDALENWMMRKKRAHKIEAIWCADNEPAWTYKTAIPHATFNVMDEGEVQCRGIVFELKTLSNA